jgi:hypothetical protein
MSIAAANLSYLGQPSAPAQNQVLNSNDSGQLGKTIAGIATFILDGATTTGLVINLIDGVQKVFQSPTNITNLYAVAAPVTIGGVANQAVYQSAGSTGQYRVGNSVVIAGFTNSANNGTFTINALTSSTIQVTNSSAVAETNYQATASVSAGAVLPAPQVGRAYVSAANVADTAAVGTTFTITAITNATITGTISSAGTNLQTLSVLVELFSVV